MIFLNF